MYFTEHNLGLCVNITILVGVTVYFLMAISKCICDSVARNNRRRPR